jgi:lipopolysaccharide/colanic/teichoic acid biosynthesis glycosyltransferase
VRSKRALDLTLGSVALIAAMPILVGVALAMRLSGDTGPFLFRARRVGKDARIITVFKVRTMTPGAEGTNVTVAGDRRVTRLGWILRRFRIDELPQLVNVIRGEMSLVGPRPEDPSFVDLSIPIHRRVFTAKPGITGLAQLDFRDEALRLTGADAERRYREQILPEKLLKDAEYLDRQSLRLDLEIMARTVAVIFR